MGFVFQSTLSVRRATSKDMLTILDHAISIHALREESDAVAHFLAAIGEISIHALREESDQAALPCLPCVGNFNPRSP